MNPATLEAARSRISELFTDQCLHGAQTQALKDQHLAACGQFIGGAAKTLSQRGLHGTAAALRVLAQSPDHNNIVPQLVARLVHYLATSEDAELRCDDRSVQTRLMSDWGNVIKLSEVLYALSRVPPSVEEASKLKAEIVHRLRAAVIEHKGWPYFVDHEDARPQLLPTAYAILALGSLNEDVSQPTEFVLAELERAAQGKSNDVTTGADITTRVACLYALAYGAGHNHHSSHLESRLSALFLPLWSGLERVMRDNDLEQNVEYWHKHNTYYVRVPWQLYLLALAARLRYYRVFGTYTAQAKLRSTVIALAAGNFRYPHSGEMVSSRTNAIAFDVLGNILAELRRYRWPFTPVYLVDLCRTSWITRGIVLLSAGVVILYSVYQWLCGNPSIGEFAPEFLAAGLVTVALWAFRR